MINQKYPIMPSAFKYLNHLQKLDNQRKQYLSEQDALKYYNSCNELGIEAEDKYLYERGHLEILLKNKEVQL